MALSDVSSVAAILRKEGYEARNLGQVGITVWKDGRGIFLSAEEIANLNGHVAREIVNRLGPAGKNDSQQP